MNFLLYFLANVLIGAMFITGWYNITRGDWRKNPDDTKYWGGKLFSPWLRFWETEIGKEKVYYRGFELKKFTNALESQLRLVYKYVDPTIVNDDSYWYYYNEQWGLDTIIVGQKTLDLLYKRLFIAGEDVQLESVLKDSKINVSFYKMKPVYKYPEWLRDPLAACIYCFSSVYGTFFWFMTNLVAYLNLNHLAFHWYVLVITWPAYCFTLSFISPWFKKLSN